MNTNHTTNYQITYNSDRSGIQIYKKVKAKLAGSVEEAYQYTQVDIDQEIIDLIVTVTFELAKINIISKLEDIEIPVQINNSYSKEIEEHIDLVSKITGKNREQLIQEAVENYFIKYK